MKKTISVLLALLLMVTCLTGTVAAQTGQSSFAEDFANPQQSMPRIRYWWPSAEMSADQLKAEIAQIHEAGFSGFEIIYKNGGGVSGVDLEQYGWGTDAFNSLVEVAYDEAERYGMQVDLTIGANWPAALPTITPDDDTASKILAYEVLDLSAEDFTEQDGQLLYTGKTPKPAPTAETAQKQDLVAVIAAKKTGDTRIDRETVYAAATGEENNLEIPVTLMDPDSMTVVSTQEEFTWMLPAGENPEDYLLFGFYMQGNGHAVSGTTAQTSYAIDHYSKEATEAVTEYWENIILTDKIREHLENFGGDLFEDSLELKSNQIPWTKLMLEEFSSRNGYDLLSYLPVYIDRFPAIGFMQSAPTCQRYGFADDTDARITEDYTETVNSLYLENHIAVLEAWTQSLNMDYRVQAYSGFETGHYDSTTAASMVSVIEGESLAFMEARDGYNSWRFLSGGAHMGGHQVISNEMGAVFRGGYQVTFPSLVDIMNKNYAGGCNQIILHGFASDYSGGSVSWPGWHPFGSMFSDPWNYRQPAWENMDLLTEYVGRTQKILRSGVAKVDVAIYRDGKKLKDDPFTDALLTDYGYNYEYIGPGILDLPLATVTGGVLSADASAYKVLILNNESSMKLDAAEKILSFAKAGLPVVVLGQTPDAVKSYAAGNYAEEDAKLTAVMEELLALENVYSVDTQEEVAPALLEAGIVPAAQYSEPATVMTVHRQDGANQYYWMYNYGEEAETIEMTLTGEGVPYLLNAWSGEIAPIACYTASEGKVTVQVDVDALDTAIVVVSEDSLAALATDSLTEADGKVVVENGKLMLKASEAGSYAFKTADGKEFSETVGSVEQPIDLTGGNWTMQVESWTEGSGPNDTAKTQLAPYQGALIPWSAVAGMEGVSGRAVYSTAVTLPESWTDDTAALLNLNTGNGTVAITSVKVNGVEVDGINQSTGTVDLRTLLNAGENTLEITVASTLQNVMSGQAAMEYGLTAAGITPYVLRELTVPADSGESSSEPSSSEESSGTSSEESSSSSSESQPNTGEAVPYAVIVLAVAAGGALLLAKKRRTV